MKPSWRQTTDTVGGVNGVSASARKVRVLNADDVASARFSTATENTLTGNLVGGGGELESSIDGHHLRELEEREEASAAIDALNQFIFVAGHTFKGRQLNGKDRQRLEEAAKQVGLSLDVVDALVEQTSDPSAVLKYCLASDDAFARRMKNDPQLSRLLEVGAKQDNIGGFDVADSVWRIFMHKIVQQFLKDHRMNLSDVMSKESLTSRLYHEALRNETKSSTVGFGYDQNGGSRMRRDYTSERQKLMISKDEAQRARQHAEANMAMVTHALFAPTSTGAEYYTSDDRSIATDDVLSLRPGRYSLDDHMVNRVGPEAFQRSDKSEPQTCSADRPSFSPRKRQVPTEPKQQETSTVRHALAVFSKPQPPGQDKPKRQRRSSLDELEKSKVVATRTLREDEIDDAEMDEVELPNKPRRSLLALQEAKRRILKSKAIFERTTPNQSTSPDKALQITRGQAKSTPNVKKLNPDVRKRFESQAEGHKPDDSPGAEVVNRTPGGGRIVQSRRLKFEAMHNDAKREGDQRRIHEGRASFAKSDKASSGRINFQGNTGKIAANAETDLVKRKNKQSHPPSVVLASSGSDDSLAPFSDVTQSTSSLENNHSTKYEQWAQPPPGPISQPLHSSENQTGSLDEQGYGQGKASQTDKTSRSSPSPTESQSTTRQQRKLLASIPGVPVHGNTTSESAEQRQAEPEFDVDMKHGWINFVASFAGPPGHSSYELRSGRGLSEGDNDSLRQPSVSPSADSTHALREKQAFGQNSPTEPNQSGNSNCTSSKDTWTRKMHGNKIPPQPTELGTEIDDKENGMRPVESAGWTTFQNSPFQDFGGPAVRASRFQQTQAAVERQSGNKHDVSLTAISDEHFADRTSLQGTASEPFKSGAYRKGTDLDRIPDDVMNVIVWSADRSDPADFVREQEIESQSQMDPQQAQEFPIQFESSPFRVMQSTQNKEGYQHPFRSQKAARGPHSGSQGRLMETARSMSSESDFSAFNSYNETDMRRLQTLNSGQARTGANIPERSSPYRSHDRKQPDAPLLSKRASRASEMINRDREFQASNDFASAAQQDIDMQMDMNSLHFATCRSPLDYTVQDGAVDSNDFDRSKATVVECPVVLQQPCEIGAKKTCSVGGVTIIEQSFQPMNGGPPTISYVKRSDSTLYSITQEEERQDERDTFSSDEWDHEDKKHDQSTVSRTFKSQLVHPSLRESLFRVEDESKARGSAPVMSSSKDGEWDEYSNSYARREHAHASVPSAPGLGSARTSLTTGPTSRVTPAVSSGAHQGSLARSRPYGLATSLDTIHDTEHRLNSGGGRVRYLEEVSFDQGDEEATSPTQLRSADSESTIDEEELRRAAERRGFSQELVDTILGQTRNKIRRSPLNVEPAMPPVTYQDYEAPIDSDTCRPASARHLQKEIGPDGNDPAISWGAIQDIGGYSDRGMEFRPQDPSPRQAQARIAALYGTEAGPYHGQETFAHGNPGLQELIPDGISDGDLKLLNRFVEVASSNFNGQRLSPESEQRVRKAAEKVGLSQKFVDQMLHQSVAYNTTQNAGYSPLPAIGVPSLDDQSTYVKTATTRSPEPGRHRKRSRRDAGCNAWEQWENLTNVVRGWANCGAPGGVHDSDDEDDGSSASSDGVTDEVTRKLRKSQVKKKKKEKGSKTRHEV